jgi:hypothetical protein
MRRHGETSGEVDPGTFFGKDPDLALIHADMSAWVAAHPCQCEDEGEPCFNCNPIE